MDTSHICDHLIMYLTNLLVGHLSSSQDHVSLDHVIPKVPVGHMVNHMSLSHAVSQDHMPLFLAWSLDYNWALG